MLTNADTDTDMATDAGFGREARRQQGLLLALWRDAPGPVLRGWLREGRGGAIEAGLSTYRANAGAIAERALQVAFPTVAALVGAVAFAALARDLWRQHPPQRGDLGEWGAALPDLIAANPALASEPYLPDSARLDWLVHQASRAADGPAEPPALDALGTHSPEQLQLVLRPGCALLASVWPVASLWSAHQHAGDDRFAGVRTALAAAVAEQAWVYREGWAVRVAALEPSAAAFMAAILAGSTVADALDSAGDDFDFEAWLVQALQGHWLHGVALQPPLPSTATP